MKVKCSFAQQLSACADYMLQLVFISVFVFESKIVLLSNITPFLCVSKSPLLEQIMNFELKFSKCCTLKYRKEEGSKLIILIDDLGIVEPIFNWSVAFPGGGVLGGA